VRRLPVPAHPVQISNGPASKQGQQGAHTAQHRPTGHRSNANKWLHALVVVYFCVALYLPQAEGQGLQPPAPGRVGATAGQFGTLRDLYAKSKSAQLAYKAGRRSACSTAGNSLCGASSGSAGAAQLMVATSPVSYDARNIAHVSSLCRVRGTADPAVAVRPHMHTHTPLPALQRLTCSEGCKCLSSAYRLLTCGRAATCCMLMGLTHVGVAPLSNMTPRGC
jgi:hypothetical protein